MILADKYSSPNPLKVEVKTFYPIEFGVGKYAIRKVREKLDVELNEDEAASVALHIVNAEYDTGVRNTMNITCLIRDVVNIVSEYLNIELQEESLHYARFITHLKFLGQRIFTGQMLGDDYQNAIYLIADQCSGLLAMLIIFPTIRLWVVLKQSPSLCSEPKVTFRILINIYR